MTPLLADLQHAVLDVLTKHGRLDLRDRLVAAVLGAAVDPADDQAIVEQICRCFNAIPVDA